MEVDVKQQESLEAALKIFRRKCQKSGLFAEIRKRAHYVKPSQLRQEAARRAARREEKRLKKQNRRRW